ncbi:hypothetical protein J3R83DRAFT_5431 [Lanmaoa asiatica]|nr:hypothetical protein J3R83DRAFT_5431 [Lanmaoa asiatica]
MTRLKIILLLPSVFWELLQNSDDARSSAVEICYYETAAYLRWKDDEQQSNVILPLPSLKTMHVAQWTFQNNGITFRDEDWTYLRKIAEGSPDEEKIGVFGVGK